MFEPTTKELTADTKLFTPPSIPEQAAVIVFEAPPPINEHAPDTTEPVPPAITLDAPEFEFDLPLSIVENAAEPVLEVPNTCEQFPEAILDPNPKIIAPQPLEILKFPPITIPAPLIVLKPLNNPPPPTPVEIVFALDPTNVPYLAEIVLAYPPKIEA